MTPTVYICLLYQVEKKSVNSLSLFSTTWKVSGRNISCYLIFKFISWLSVLHPEVVQRGSPLYEIFLLVPYRLILLYDFVLQLLTLSSSLFASRTYGDKDQGIYKTNLKEWTMSIIFLTKFSSFLFWSFRSHGMSIFLLVYFSVGASVLPFHVFCSVPFSEVY